MRDAQYFVAGVAVGVLIGIALSIGFLIAITEPLV